ncbi:MAG TPA: HAMP domain-containing sensor histidine kinase [Ktedonobacterales bacterium]|nr:HAMP domain-containing sensor histidine kinase [Ktedonobacterales bacterium]
MQGRTNLARAASAFVIPSDEHPITPVDSEIGQDEHRLGIWLAELVRYTLCSETAGIVLGPMHNMPMRLIATAGVAPGNYTAWWDDVYADIIDSHTGQEAVHRPTARHAYLEDDEEAGAAPLIVRLTLPLLSGSRRFGMLIVEFILGERIMPDTLLTARALAQLVASVLDHDRLARERARLSSTVAQLRSENANLEAAIIQATHELRGPLTTMRLGSQLAERHLRLVSERGMASDPPNTHLARAISAATLANQNVDKAERLLTDLTDMARIRAGSLEMRVTRCDLATVVEEAVASQRVAWPTRIIYLDLPCGAVQVMADADRVSQVMGNYITNALKYSPATQPVEVRVEVGDGEVRVAVCDHGVGLSRLDQRRIWERFYRTARFHRAKPDGLGVGLFICRQIIEQMGGKVGVESIPGEGSTFWFAVPSAVGQ